MSELKIYGEMSQFALKNGSCIKREGSVSDSILNTLKGDYGVKSPVCGIKDEGVQVLRRAFALNEGLKFKSNPINLLGDNGENWKRISSGKDNDLQTIFVLNDPSKNSKQKLVFDSCTQKTTLCSETGKSSQTIILDKQGNMTEK